MEAMCIPSLFKCPISLQVMREPVTLCTGVSYERESIERWFEEGQLSCPSTLQALDTLELIPNHTLKRLIQAWCSSNSGIHNIPTKDPVTDIQIQQVLLNIRNSPTRLGNLRSLADLGKKSERNRAFIAASGGPSLLISTLCRTRNEVDFILGEEALAVLASLPIHEAKEECIRYLQSPITIDTICWFFCKGSFDAKLHAAQVFHGLLTADQSFKAVFRPDEDVFHNLRLLLRDGCAMGTKTAVEILMIISPVRRNRMRAVAAGVAVTLIDILPDAQRNMAEKYLSLLEILCQSAEGRASVCGHPLGISVLVRKIARVTELGTEAAIGALWQIFRKCKTPSVVTNMEEAGIFVKLCYVLQIGCRSSTRHRAKEIVEAQRGRSSKMNQLKLNAEELKHKDIHYVVAN